MGWRQPPDSLSDSGEGGPMGWRQPPDSLSDSDGGGPMGWRQPPDSLSDSDEPADNQTILEKAETRKSTSLQD